MSEYDDAMREFARQVAEAPEAPLPKLHDDTCGGYEGRGWGPDGNRCPKCGGTGRDLSSQ